MKLSWKNVTIAVALLVVCAYQTDVSLSADDTAEWKVGLARVNITPTEPVRMAGYGSRVEPSQGVASELFAKSLALEDREGNRAVLVTTDVLGLAGDFAEATCRRIIERTGLERRQVLLNSSHTHTGPVIDGDEETLDFPPEHARATHDYSVRLQGQLVDVAVEALSKLEPAKIAWGVGVVHFPMNRREFTLDGGVRLGVNARGLADRSVPFLRIDSPNGQVRAVLYGVACHNTTLGPSDMLISGDFAGYSQAILERELAGAQAMFVQNCGGDANPYPRGSEEISKDHGEELAAEVLRALGTELLPVRGPLRTEFEPTALPLQPAPPQARLDAMEAGGSWPRFVARQMREVLQSQGKLPETYTTPIAVWQFGADLTLVALPGEVVVDYAILLEKALGPTRLWVAAYSNDVFGYLPSARVIEEGGYETRGLYTGGIGFFTPEAQGVVVEKVRELATKAGRPMKE